MNANVNVTLYEWDERGMFYGGSLVTHDLELRFVTHADYRSLEERMGALVNRFIEVGDELNATKEELAALRVRVGGLVEAVRMEDNVRASIETSRNESASEAFRTALAGCTKAKNEAVRSIA